VLSIGLGAIIGNYYMLKLLSGGDMRNVLLYDFCGAEDATYFPFSVTVMAQ